MFYLEVDNRSTLVVTHPETLTDDTKKQIEASVKDKTGVERVLVLDEGVEIGAIDHR